MTEYTECAHCGGQAEVRDRYVCESSDGPMEHVITNCLLDRSHLFNGPVYMVQNWREQGVNQKQTG